MNEVFDLLKSAKAYVATLVALGGIMLTLSADENFKSLGIPDTVLGKIAGVGTLLVAFGAVFGVRNERTIAQAQEDLERAKNRETAPRKPRKRKAKVVTRRPDKLSPETPTPPAPPPPPEGH